MQFFRICSIILLKRQNHDDYAPKCNSPNENNSDQYVTNKVSNIFWYSNSDTQFCLHKRIYTSCIEIIWWVTFLEHSRRDFAKWVLKEALSNKFYKNCWFSEELLFHLFIFVTTNLQAERRVCGKLLFVMSKAGWFIHFEIYLIVKSTIQNWLL